MSRPLFRMHWLPLVASTLVLAACQHTPPRQEVVPMGAAQDDAALRQESGLPGGLDTAPGYLLQAGDEMELRFADHPELDQTLRVRPDGFVNVAMIGGLRAAGRTPEALERTILARYQELSGGAGERAYLIQVGDELEVKFAYLPQFNERVNVRPDGKITLQLAGTVKARGLTPEALQQELIKRYARVLKRPELAVIMRTFSSRSVQVRGPGNTTTLARSGLDNLQSTLTVKSAQASQVFVGGEVLRPGVINWRPGLTLVQALTEAGGSLSSAQLDGIIVLRKVPGKQPLVIRRNLVADMTGRGTNDIVLEASDVVVAPQNAAASLAQNLDLYVFRLIPFLRNSSFGFSYALRDSNN